MSLANRLNNQHIFDLREMRGWPGVSNGLLDSLYELESRSFGRVRKDGAAVFFDASVPLMSSIELNPANESY